MKQEVAKTREDLIAELEEAHRQIEELNVFRSLVKEVSKALPDILALLNEDGSIVDAERDIISPLVPYASFPEDIENMKKQAIKEALRTDKVQVMEYCIQNGDREKWFEGRIAPLPPRENHNRELIMIARDITEKKLAVEELRKSEGNYRILAENIPEKIVVKDREHYFVSCNNSFASDFGVTPREIVGKHTDDMYPPDVAKRLKEAEIKVMTTGESIHFMDYFTSNNKQMIYDSQKMPVIDGKGNIAGTISIIRDVTEIRKSEDALRFSDAALKSIHECIYAMDIDFNVTYWNHICEETFGIKASEAIGKYIGDLIKLGENRPGENERRSNILVKQGHNREEQLYIVPAGNIWVDVYAQSIDRKGVRHGWITLASDITERKQVEQSLRESEERFSKAFRSVPDGIVISRLDNGVYIEVNNSFTTLTGFEREEVLGKTAIELGLWVNETEKQQAVELMDRQGHLVNFGHEFRKKSGESRFGLITIEPIELNGIPCMISVLTDITERKKAELQVEYQASLVENVTEAIISHDANLKVLSWNTAAEKIFKVKKEEIIGGDIRDLCEIQPIGVTLEQISQEVNGKGLWKGEAIHILKSGESIHMRVSTMMVKDENRKRRSYVLIMSDITEEKKAEKELKELYKKEMALRRELENEMKKRTEFSAAIVHELKTPLTAIISSSELMAETAPEGPLQKLATNINRSSYELDKRTNELLDMTKGELGIQTLMKAPLDIREMLESLKMEFDTLLSRKDLSFSLDLPQELPIVEADQGKIRQVIFNLINNANKYTRSGGSVTLRAYDDKDEVVVCVSDTGLGLTKKEKEYAFEPYRQLIDGARVEGGMGLGLAISKNLVTAHGGRIWVESKKGKGSSFFFSIPKNNPENQQ